MKRVIWYGLMICKQHGNKKAHHRMRALFIIYIAFNFHAAVGQITNSEYEIFSTVLLDLKSAGVKDRFLVRDSTTSFFIDLSNVNEYIKNKSSKNFKLVLNQFFSGDLLIEMGNDSLLYYLIEKHNQINSTRKRIENKFDKMLSVDMLNSRNECIKIYFSLHCLVVNRPNPIAGNIYI